MAIELTAGPRLLEPREVAQLADVRDRVCGDEARVATHQSRRGCSTISACFVAAHPEAPTTTPRVTSGSLGYLRGSSESAR